MRKLIASILICASAVFAQTEDVVMTHGTNLFWYQYSTNTADKVDLNPIHIPTVTSTNMSVNGSPVVTETNLSSYVSTNLLSERGTSMIGAATNTVSYADIVLPEAVPPMLTLGAGWPYTAHPVLLTYTTTNFSYAVDNTTTRYETNALPVHWEVNKRGGG